MHKVIVSGIELTVDNENEILRMGGPWIGDVYIGNDLISKGCLIDNFVYQENMNLLFFVKFNKVSKYQWYFSINFYNIDSKMVCQFDHIFDMVWLGKFFSKNELEIYRAFHNKSENRREVFKLDEQDFHVVSQ